jgi:hypothetical protein
MQKSIGWYTFRRTYSSILAFRLVGNSRNDVSLAFWSHIGYTPPHSTDITQQVSQKDCLKRFLHIPHYPN